MPKCSRPTDDSSKARVEVQASANEALIRLERCVEQCETRARRRTRRARERESEGPRRSGSVRIRDQQRRGPVPRQRRGTLSRPGAPGPRTKERSVHLPSTPPSPALVGSWLRSRNPAAHERERLWLLGSPSDQVHGLPLHRTWPSTPLTGETHENDESLWSASPPHEEDFGFVRGPLAPRLHGFFSLVVIRRRADRPRLASGGEGGIRTLGAVRHTRFPSVLLRPLGHLSTFSRKGDERDPWRRGRDLNPRDPCGSNGFRNRPVQPLRHLSAPVSFVERTS